MELNLKQINDWWNKSLREHFIWWAVLVVVLIIGSGIWWLWRPMYKNITPNSQLDALETKLKSSQTRLDSLRKIADDWLKQPEWQPADLELVLPSTPDIPNLVVQTDTLASHSGLQLQSLSITERATPAAGAKAAVFSLPNGVRSMQVSINLTGVTYVKLKAFLQAMQSAWRVVALEDLNFGRANTVALKLVTYYLPQ